MKRDQQLVADFLSASNQAYGTSFTVVSRPEEEERRLPSVEAIARDNEGNTLAIEHTLIEPFEGKCQDDDRFMKVFGGLEGSPRLTLPGHNVELTVDVGAIPTGVSWPIHVTASVAHG